MNQKPSNRPRLEITPERLAHLRRNLIKQTSDLLNHTDISPETLRDLLHDCACAAAA